MISYLMISSHEWGQKLMKKKTLQDLSDRTSDQFAQYENDFHLVLI